MESVNFTGESKREGIKVSKVSFNHPIIRKKKDQRKKQKSFFFATLVGWRMVQNPNSQRRSRRIRQYSGVVEREKGRAR